MTVELVQTNALECPGQETMGEKVEKPTSMMMYPTMCDMAEGCHMANDSTDGGDHLADLQPCSACCCYIESLFCKFPACIGCQGKSECLFLQGTCACCKILDCSDAEKRCCAFVCNEYLIMPRTCIQQQVQCFCVDRRIALPPTKDVPCIVNAFCFTCYPKTGCCLKVGDIYPELKK
mmetsp:Transcript_10928/g.26806  ORF Transcript_10928/g.26806 Transcript_10928/m.26806 type:complete len:177 (+) Transcript_10928:78-608(+)